MKKLLYPLAFLTVFFTVSCSDTCERTVSYINYEPIYRTTDEVRSALSFSNAPREINNPGRLYFKDGYMYINEAGEGIHIVNNTNPAFPVSVGFVNIPGNFDLAAKGNFLYADSYVDLVVLDISDPTNITLVNRVESVFSDYNSWSGRWDEANQTILVGYNETWVEDEISMDCDDGGSWWGGRGGWLMAEDATNFSIANQASGTPGAGVGGSLAKFTIYDDYLYTIDWTDMRLFDLSDQTTPEKTETIPLGWGIETIYPYGDKLFLGAQNGMHIYDNSNPASPEWLSTYDHVNSCDPVVVQGDWAYVTLRSGNVCQGFTNQLDVVNISDLTNPFLHQTYQMENPHGLGIDDDCLFITEGANGMKFMDASNLDGITLVDEIRDIHTIDVIALNDILMVIGEDGFHQYSYDCEAKEWSFLSTIHIAKL
ncbi:MAG: hypothetical protein R8G66_23530 [Cytophagales bacterium]|nr:hypothetical protein [Cytophagales bacterium]